MSKTHHTTGKKIEEDAKRAQTSTVSQSDAPIGRAAPQTAGGIKPAGTVDRDATNVKPGFSPAAPMDAKSKEEAALGKSTAPANPVVGKDINADGSPIGKDASQPEDRGPLKGGSELKGEPLPTGHQYKEETVNVTPHLGIATQDNPHPDQYDRISAPGFRNPDDVVPQSDKAAGEAGRHGESTEGGTRPGERPDDASVDKQAEKAASKADKTNNPEKPTKIVIAGSGSVPLMIDGSLRRLDRGKGVDATKAEMAMLDRQGIEYKKG
jgi:hypothetical protein